MTQMIQSGTFYHSSGDVYEAVPAEGMERAARFHAFLIEQADKAPEALITAGKGSPYKAIHRLRAGAREEVEVARLPRCCALS